MRVCTNALLVVCEVACALPAIGSSIGGGSATLPPQTGTISPLSYGAIANDGNDDGVAFRLALAAACAGPLVLDVPVGTFDIGQESGQLGGLNLTGCDGLTIKGQGYASVLRPVARQMQGGVDYYLINLNISTDHVEIKDLKIDGRRTEFSCQSGVCEQIHLISTNVASYVRINGVTFVESYGDAIKLGAVSKVRIENNTFLGMRRNAVTLNGMVYDVIISGNTFGDVADQYLDFESGDDAIRRVSVVGNTFLAHKNAKIAIAVGGTQVADISFMSNTFDDGSILTGDADRLAFVGNMMSGSSGYIYFKGGTVQASIVGNVFTPTGTTPCIAIEEHSGVASSDIAIGSNVCVTENGSGMSYTSGPGRLALSGNVVRTTGTGGTGIGTYGNTSTEISGVTVTGNMLYGFDNGVTVYNRYGAVANAAISGNVVESTKALSKGVYNLVFNAAPYTQDYSKQCRVDGNVFSVENEPEVVNGPDSGSVGPDAGEGCLEHGDAVPP